MMTPSDEGGAQEHRQSKLLELNLLTCSETQSSNRCQDLKVHFALENWPYGEKFNRIKSLGVQKHRVLLINNQNQKASRVEKLFTKARRVNSHPKQPSRVQGCDTEPYPQKPHGPNTSWGSWSTKLPEQIPPQRLKQARPSSPKCFQWRYSSWDTIQTRVDGR